MIGLEPIRMGSDVNGAFGFGESFVIGGMRSKPVLSLQTAKQPDRQVERQNRYVFAHTATTVPNQRQGAAKIEIAGNWTKSEKSPFPMAG